ncbi:MAG: glycosyltransferase [Woeseia sp.]
MLTEQEHSLIRRETAIPGFRYLLHPDRLASLLETDCGIEGLQNLRLNYLRYKAGMNCIARFEFPNSGEWSYGYAKAFGADAGIKLQKARDKPACSGPLGPGRVMLDEEQILVCFFPIDAKLGSLCRLTERRPREELLSRIFKSHSGWQEAVFTPLNYKPERRFVARLSNHAGDCAAVKFYSRAEFEKVRKFRKRLRESDGVRIPACIGGSKAHRVLAYGWLPGSTLRPQIADRDLAAVEAAGEAIAHFHRGTQPGLEHLDRKLMVSSLDALASELAILLPALEPCAGTLVRQLAQWWLDRDDPRVPIHGDFYDKQVTAADDGVALIDCDNAYLGDPLSDIGCFIAHLERSAINHQMEAADIPAVVSALLRGYRNIGPGLNTRELNRYIALSLFQLVHNPFRDRSEDWPSQTVALLQRCSELFASVGPATRDVAAVTAQKPRVGYVLKVYPRFSQTFVMNEILAHEAAGLPLDIFSLRLSDDVRFHESLARVRSRVHQVRRPSGKASGFLEQLHATARLLPDVWQVVADNPEVIASDMYQAVVLARMVHEKGIRHLHAHFGTVATTASRLAARMAGITYSFTAHAKDIFHESVDEQVLHSKLADAAAVVTVSDYNLNYLKSRYGSAAERVIHINNGLPLEEFPFSEARGREPLILAVGRLVEKKGFAELIRACHLLKAKGRRFRCEIAGGGVLMEELSAMIQDLGLADFVRLLGPQPQGDIRRKLQLAAVLAGPSVVAADQDRDGLPTILLEAMAMGTPCISTDVTGIPEVLREGETGLSVPQRDVEGLAAACERLLDDPELGVRLARNARRQVEEKFDIVTNAGLIRQMIESVIDGSGR